MKSIKRITILCMAALLIGTSSCIKEVFPEGESKIVSEDQIEDVGTLFRGLPGLMKKVRWFVSSHYDIGYPGLMIMRESMGADMAQSTAYMQWGWWYAVAGINKDNLGAQFPWTIYYKINFQADQVIAAVPDPASAIDENRWGAGIAYFYKAFVYSEMAQLFQQGTYLNNPQGPTIPLVEHNTSLDKLRDNPRMPADQMYPKILEYLTLAETYLSDYTPTGISDISLNAVHGQMARVYLITGQWPKAEEYAKKAQTGREALTEAQWKDKQNGFNNPTSQKSWIWCLTYTSDDDAVKGQLYNWMNQMSTETNMDSYSHWDSNVKMIDAHLYSQIPTTDWRRESWVSPTNEYPVNSDSPVKDKIPAYTNIKFRPGQGNYTDYLVAHAISIPLMRMEEMMLIEAEAAGRQTLANGIMLLETFGKLRNPAYTSTATKLSDFIDEIWLQKRIELWGEGQAIFDIKRLNKGITRSYTGTNHPVGYRFNTEKQPYWMDYVIVQTEGDNNTGLGENNPNPERPSDSAPAW